MSMKDLMKQAQEMQSKLQDAQSQLAALSVTGEAGAGAVSIVVTGRHEAKSAKIDEDLFDGEDKEVLEDLIVAAINDAARKIEEASRDHMTRLTAGMKLPEDLSADEE